MHCFFIKKERLQTVQSIFPKNKIFIKNFVIISYKNILSIGQNSEAD